jgi:CBS domain-containing protein
MWDEDCGFLPVVDPASGELRGVVTDRDLCMTACVHGRPLDELPVRAAMRTDVQSCVDSDPLGHVRALMREHRIRRVPVLGAGGRLLGVVSVDDLARDALRDPSGGAAREVVEVLAALGPLRAGRSS